MSAADGAPDHPLAALAWLGHVVVAQDPAAAVADAEPAGGPRSDLVALSSGPGRTAARSADPGRDRGRRARGRCSRTSGSGRGTSSSTVPTGPLRCLPMMISATPGFSEASFVVVLVAEHEHDEVGVLLDVPALPEVGHHRPLVGPRLDGARELRDGDHRDVQLTRQDLQPAADLADLLDAAVARVLGPHQLQVVDDQQPERVAAGAAGAPSRAARARRDRSSRRRTAAPW